MWRSVPQIVVVPTLTITSVGSARDAGTRPLLGRYSGDGDAAVNAGGALSGSRRDEAKPS